MTKTYEIRPLTKDEPAPALTGTLQAECYNILVAAKAALTVEQVRALATAGQAVSHTLRALEAKGYVKGYHVVTAKKGKAEAPKAEPSLSKAERIAQRKAAKAKATTTTESAVA